MARASQLFLPTLRDAPADAEAVSHKLLVRGGYIRQVAAGVWTFMPLGWRVHQKVVQVVREEIDAIGGQEMLMPVLTPFELWQQSGRDYIDEIFRLKDRYGRDYVLPMTHEQAYHRIFDRCGLEVHAAVAESGMMGGSASLDFLAPAGAGENLLVTCERCDY